MYITENYKLLLKDLHNRKKSFGAGQPNVYLLDGEHINCLKKSVRVLDYGCGKGTFVKYVEKTYTHIDMSGYDPAIEEYSKQPEGKFDFIWCTDVLEHIEPELLENVLNHIYELSSNFLYVSANCSKAKKTLIDGRNAHLIIKPKEWWKNHFQKLGNIIKEEVTISKWGKNKELESINYHVIIKK